MAKQSGRKSSLARASPADKMGLVRPGFIRVYNSRIRSSVLEVRVKKFIVMLTTAMIASAGYTATIRDNCGCGFGTMALGDKDPTISSQLAATFLNNLCGNQTFGISSGTLDCNPAPSVAVNERVKEFIGGNMDQLAMDIAIGQGESLNSLADLMEVPAKDRPVLYTKLQKNFDSIFTAHDLTSDDVALNLEKVVNG